MQKFETCDEVEAQRCKRAQYLGRVSTIALSGSYVTGLVYSVVEDGASLPKKWIVRISPQSRVGFGRARA